MKKINLDDEASRDDLKARFPIEFMAEEDTKRNPKATRRFYLCAAFYYNLLGDIEKVYENNLKVVDWWDGHPAIKEEEFHRYIVDISNLLYALYKKGEYQKIPELLEKIDQEASTNFHDQKVVFHRLSMFKLLFMYVRIC